MYEEIGPGLDERHLEALRDRVSRSPFHRWAGLQLVSLGDGTAELAMDLRAQHFDPQGIVHGGIITAGPTPRSGWRSGPASRPGLTHRTAQLNVHFLAKGEGNRLVGRGRAVYLGQRVGVGRGPRR